LSRGHLENRSDPNKSVRLDVHTRDLRAQVVAHLASYSASAFLRAFAGKTQTNHGNLSTRRRMLKKGANFFQLVSNLFCIVWIGPEGAQAQARVGLVFGLSPQARPRARPPRPGQARNSPSLQCKARARPKPALFMPAPAL
jgi:hypothetical protein